MQDIIPFNKPFVTGNELVYIAEAQRSGRLSGDGIYTKRCHAWLRVQTGCHTALLTHSCTSALDMAAMLLDIRAGDEIIVPSYTFVSSASAFVLRGGVPVFVDIRPDTLNLDERLIEGAITARTRAIVPVHYAGVSCEMDAILEIAKRNDLKVVEDAAQGVLASYKGRALGGLGDLGALSFHDSKNIIAGEGGSLLIRDADLSQRAEIIREKGTDRSRFFRGEVDKYTWQEVGSSYLPSELVSAFLWAQLEQAKTITAERISIWCRYHDMLADLEQEGLLRRPIVPTECSHNGHLYYVLLAPEIDRQNILDEFKQNNIGACFHYVPLHSSPAGMRCGRAHGDLKFTDMLSRQLIRLPLWIGLTQTQQEKVGDVLRHAIRIAR
jgi:dTDP-4-amino-4,6-dideoxygalactose transaminase